MLDFSTFGESLTFRAVAFELRVFAVVFLMMPDLADLEDFLAAVLVVDAFDQQLINLLPETFLFLEFVLAVWAIIYKSIYINLLIQLWILATLTFAQFATRASLRIFKNITANCAKHLIGQIHLAKTVLRVFGHQSLHKLGSFCY